MDGRTFFKKYLAASKMNVMLNSALCCITINITCYQQLLEHALGLKDVALVDQLRRLEIIESTSYNGVLVWKINDFAKKKLDAMNGVDKSIYSPYFFTSRFGYKMRAR